MFMDLKCRFFFPGEPAMFFVQGVFRALVMISPLKIFLSVLLVLVV